MLTVILIIVGLSLLILGHEAAHFWAAKLFGLKVDEFGIGFPPRIFGVRKYTGGREEKISISEKIDIDVEVEELNRGKTKIIKETITEKIKEVDESKSISKWLFFWRYKEPKDEIGGLVGNDTIYSVNFLPFGGFVKIAGEYGGEEPSTDEEKKNLFSFQPAWKKSVIILAGVFINFIIGWFLVSLIFMIGVPQKLFVAGTEPGSPAESVGLKEGDVILNYANAKDFTSFVNGNRGKEIALKIMRGDQELDLSATPRVNPGEGKGALGVYLAEGGVPREGFFQSFVDGLRETWEIFRLTATAFFLLIKNLLFKASLLPGVVGPVGIYGVAKETTDLGLIYFVQLLAVISINLSALNLIPVPVLDGGRFLIILIEKIKGSPVSKRAESIATGVGLVFLLLIMLMVTVRDVSRL